MQLERATEFFRYRQMLTSLVLSDLRTRYRGSLLGFLWTFINPLLMLGVYTLIFSTVMRIDLENYAIHLFIGLLPWIYFQSSLVNSSSVIIRNANLIKKIYFPREVLPLSVVFGGMINYLLGCFILIPSIYFSGIHLSSTILYFPLILLIQTILIAAFCVLFSAITVYLRDVEHILGIFTMAWLYFTPVLYPTSNIPEKYLLYFNLNPMKPIIEAYQAIFYYAKAPNLYELLMCSIFSIVLFVFSLMVFGKLNKKFAEEV
ncbi:ABC transporter permease [Paenibacillus sp. D51F]